MAALRPTYRPALPYQSLSTSTSWAVNSFDRDFPGDPVGRLTHTGQQLSGARFPDGRVQAVDASQFANLMTARAMVNRQTVNEYHVNLESPAGRLVKQQMRLPFQEHSRVDPIKAAEQADDQYNWRDSSPGWRGRAIRHHVKEGVKEVALEAGAGFGAIALGLAIKAGHFVDVMELLGVQPEEEVFGHSSRSSVKIEGLGAGGSLFGLFGKKSGNLGLVRETMDGVSVFRGHDANNAFKNRQVSRMAEAEAWFHGGNLPGRSEWYLLNQDRVNKPASEIVNQIVQQEKVQSVMLTSCNVGKNLIPTPHGATVTYGLGYGLHDGRTRAGISDTRSWAEGVVVSKGKTASIYTRSAVQAELERRGMDLSQIAKVRQIGLKGEFIGEASPIGTFLDAQGKQRISVNAAGRTAEEVMKYSLPIEEAPAITAALGRETLFSAGGKSFNSLETATEGLTQSIRARSKTTNAAADFLQRAGIRPVVGSVSVEGFEQDQLASLQAKVDQARKHGMNARAEAYEEQIRTLQGGTKPGVRTVTSAADLHAAAQAPSPPARPTRSAEEAFNLRHNAAMGRMDEYRTSYIQEVHAEWKPRIAGALDERHLRGINAQFEEALGGAGNAAYGRFLREQRAALVEAAPHLPPRSVEEYIDTYEIKDARSLKQLRESAGSRISSPVTTAADLHAAAQAPRPPASAQQEFVAAYEARLRALKAEAAAKVEAYTAQVKTNTMNFTLEDEQMAGRQLGLGAREIENSLFVPFRAKELDTLHEVAPQFNKEFIEERLGWLIGPDNPRHSEILARAGIGKAAAPKAASQTAENPLLVHRRELLEANRKRLAELQAEGDPYKGSLIRDTEANIKLQEEALEKQAQRVAKHAAETAPPPKAATVTASPQKTASQVVQNVEEESKRVFHGPVLVGILAVGALVAGGIALTHHGHPAETSSTSNRHPTPEPHHGKQEQRETSTQTEHRQGGSPRSNTKIRLTDADLNVDEVDRMFTAHFKRGYAAS